MDSKEIQELSSRAYIIRTDIIRMLGTCGSGHPGGSLSAADIVAALYFKVMRIDPKNPKDPARDRFVLSKGHAAPVLYAALAQKGFFPAEELATLRSLGSRLQGHPDMKKLPGVEMSTGSLGQGLSAASGMALAGKMDKLDYRVYALLGDGEIQEGQIWEAAMSSAHYKLDNLTAFLDHNGMQIDGPTTEVMSPEPVADKWRAFGWDVQVIDGHSIKEILEAVEKAKAIKGKPQMIIAETVKGKGVSFMENKVGWHGVAPKPDEVEDALAQLVPYCFSAGGGVVYE
ncbi:MAG: transketolase [Peptococcaceae bacterium]|nr:transketolase [Peptococcaceae bacterium]